MSIDVKRKRKREHKIDDKDEEERMKQKKEKPELALEVKDYMQRRNERKEHQNKVGAKQLGEEYICLDMGTSQILRCVARDC